MVLKFIGKVSNIDQIASILRMQSRVKVSLEVCSRTISTDVNLNELLARSWAPIAVAHGALAMQGNPDLRTMGRVLPAKLRAISVAERRLLLDG